jgi:probable biosynthetic protein (TIGR04098 family)
MPRMQDAAVVPEEAAAVIRRVFPSLTQSDYAKPLDDIDVDSFDLITLRVALEESLQSAIDDADWLAIGRLDDVMGVVARRGAARRPVRQKSAIERRSLHLNMPQMAQGGLSESWLFKELGDIHWGLITRGLRVPSSEVKDTEGNRLYATFTRIKIASSAALGAYRENEHFAIDGALSRYGAGMFFNEISVQGEGKFANGEIMSSFSMRGEAGANTSLLKGQPEIPPDCDVPVQADLPAFAREYRARRAVSLPPALFETEYDIVPVHDINGVGLLYFAAYPVIKDICAARHAGRTFAAFSTASRDICYFANCEPDETLIYRIHRWQPDRDTIEIEETLSRKSDGVLMSHAATRKQRVTSSPA